MASSSSSASRSSSSSTVVSSLVDRLLLCSMARRAAAVAPDPPSMGMAVRAPLALSLSRTVGAKLTPCFLRPVMRSTRPLNFSPSCSSSFARSSFSRSLSVWDLRPPPRSFSSSSFHTELLKACRRLFSAPNTRPLNGLSFGIGGAGALRVCDILGASLSCEEDPEGRRRRLKSSADDCSDSSSYSRCRR